MLLQDLSSDNFVSKTSAIFSLQPAENIGGGFYQSATDRRNKFTSWDFDTLPKYAAFHPVCWQIAERVVMYLSEFQKTVTSGPSCMEKLIEMYQEREDQLGRCYPKFPYSMMWVPSNHPRTYLPSPTAYHGAGDLSREEWDLRPPEFPVDVSCTTSHRIV